MRHVPPPIPPLEDEDRSAIASQLARTLEEIDAADLLDALQAITDDLNPVVTREEDERELSRLRTVETLTRVLLRIDLPYGSRLEAARRLREMLL